jgi:prepilin-type N-terminal cleavage/methylation domain-containing protein
MKPNHAMRSQRGFTIIEVLACAVVVALLIGLLLPRLATTGCRVPRISCVNHLKQIGLAFRMWSNDHSEKFPWDVSMTATNPGTQDFALTGEVWRHFQAISNEVNTPKVLSCPNDKDRKPISDWAAFTNNSHLSYFVGLDASEVLPQSILAGDRNLTVSNQPAKGILFLKPGDTLGWTKAIHEGFGHFALGDGSVQQVMNTLLNKQLQAAFQSTTQSVIRISLPQ